MLGKISAKGLELNAGGKPCLGACRKGCFIKAMKPNRIGPDGAKRSMNSIALLP